jgi:hypothetical protein
MNVTWLVGAVVIVYAFFGLSWVHSCLRRAILTIPDLVRNASNAAVRGVISREGGRLLYAPGTTPPDKPHESQLNGPGRADRREHSATIGMLAWHISF